MTSLFQNPLICEWREPLHELLVARSAAATVESGAPVSAGHKRKSRAGDSVDGMTQLPGRVVRSPAGLLEAACLVVLEPHKPGLLRKRQLQRLLVWHSRQTDGVSWLDARRICAVLPDTGISGGRCFAERITRLAAVKSIRLGSRIYVWGNSEPGGEDGVDRGRLTRGAMRRDRAAEGMVATAERISRFIEPESHGHRRNDLDEAVYARSITDLSLPVWKRCIDVVGAMIGLTLFAPLMLLAAILIKLTSSGPVLFRQQRAGQGGRPFTILKFRTMVVDAEQHKAELRVFSEQDGPAFKMKNDPRVTTIGRWLRITSMDELPQFWNVLRGDMSLVGPRPLPVDEAQACSPWQQGRLAVTPGLTCTWQVHGRSQVSFDEWMRMDLEYIRRRSIFSDLHLLLMTIPAVLLRRGAQ